MCAYARAGAATTPCSTAWGSSDRAVRRLERRAPGTSPGPMRVGGFIGVVLVAALLALAPGSALAATTFSQPLYVDKELAGGEPLLWEDSIHHTLLYTSHEG